MRKEQMVYYQEDIARNNEIIEALIKLGGKLSDDFKMHLINPIDTIYYLYINPEGYIEEISSKSQGFKLLKEFYYELSLPPKRDRYIPKHKELVWCWWNFETSIRLLAFYDAKN